MAQVLSDRSTGILDLTKLGPALIQLAQFCGPVSSPVEVWTCLKTPKMTKMSIELHPCTLLTEGIDLTELTGQESIFKLTSRLPVRVETTLAEGRSATAPEQRARAIEHKA